MKVQVRDKQPQSHMHETTTGTCHKDKLEFKYFSNPTRWLTVFQNVCVLLISTNAALSWSQKPSQLKTLPGVQLRRMRKNQKKGRQEKVKEQPWANLRKGCSCIPGSTYPLISQFWSWQILPTLEHSWADAISYLKSSFRTVHGLMRYAHAI